jgi:hypothetical protein
MEENVVASEAASQNVGTNEQANRPEPRVSAHELDRLWEWGLHEDELLVNRILRDVPCPRALKFYQ